MTKLVMCATDGSEHSRIAVASAAHLAKVSGAKISFLSVSVALGGPKGPLGYQHSEAEVQHILDEAVSIAKHEGVSEWRTVEVKSRDAAPSDPPLCGGGS